MKVHLLQSGLAPFVWASAIGCSLLLMSGAAVAQTTAQTPHDPSVAIISLTQTGCQFLEPEAGTDHGFKTKKKIDCEEINEKTGILERQLKEQHPTISSSAQVSINPIYDKMRDKLIQLELERDSLLQRYTPNDRLVSDKEKEIADLNKKLANILSDPKAVWSTNPVHQGILNSLLTARAELSVLEARRSSLLKQIATYSSSAAELKKKSFVVDRLQREVNAKKEALSLYQKKAEEARISDAMDERKFSNASILERAALPLQRAGRALWIMLLITVLGSVAIAVAGAFAIEFFNTSLKNEADVEGQIGLPVLATIQYYNRLPERV